MTFIVFVMAILLNAVANILMKAGALKPEKANQLSDVFLNMIMNPVIIAGILCFGLGLAAYNYVLIRTDLSVAYPIMTSVGYVVVIMASWFFFNESLTAIQIIGILLIIAGVWMIAK